MKPVDKNMVLMNERNWHDVISNIDRFPIRISEINTLNKEITLSRISFKYNIEGNETYFNGTQEVNLKTGEYLMACNQQYTEVFIEEKGKKDLGVCVDMNVDTLRQALQAMLYPDEFFGVSEKECFFIEDSFFLKYKSNKEFHQFMLKVYHHIKSKSNPSIDEMEFEFTKQFIQHQIPHLLAYQRIPAVKRSTKNELYNKMIQSRNHIQDSIYSNISISEIAQQVFISVCRFFHLFKEAFQMSPHKYLIQLKMNEAITLFQKGKHTWTEIANLLQFADLQTFSKLFKKYVHCNPKEYARVQKNRIPEADSCGGSL